MNDDTLMSWFASHRKTYASLAMQCGSVAELMLKIEIYGSKWTKWDWVMLLSYLDYSSDLEFAEQGIGSFDRNVNPGKELLSDIFNEIDNGSTLDPIFTNKTVIMNLIEWIGVSRRKNGNSLYSKYGLLKLLSHIFKKFPKLWFMNWMFIRHRGKNKNIVKTHRLAFTLPKMAGRSSVYFESRAFMDDFISKYWSNTKYCACDDSCGII